ncbi:hypothetical protein [Nocardioides sp.]|uniref:hypothetical protein n=1 Tax=Nocardioides sp. TaxID=35761 RepID=UPI002C74BB49|nr:hypothetical protein [Nocardioides sp.]HSX67941.1 hypothetical protein [Nocardioides sp.]
MTFAVAKACVATLAVLAGHVTLSVVSDLHGYTATNAPAPAQVVEVQQAELAITP